MKPADRTITHSNVATGKAGNPMGVIALILGVWIALGLATIVVLNVAKATVQRTARPRPIPLPPVRGTANAQASRPPMPTGVGVARGAAQHTQVS